MRTCALTVLAMAASISSAAADARNITAEGFLEMNSTYRAGLVQGALASMFELGVDEKYTRSLEEGVRCQGQRKVTVWQTSIDFAKRRHPLPRRVAQNQPLHHTQDCLPKSSLESDLLLKGNP
jgi:hypothetical protein